MMCDLCVIREDACFNKQRYVQFFSEMLPVVSAVEILGSLNNDDGKIKAAKPDK